MKKDALIQYKISQAWKRTVVFMKLLRHKKANGHLVWEYDDYVFAIIWHFRNTENALLKETYKDERWGDRKSDEFRKQKLLEGKRVAFNKYEYDNQVRAIIKKIEISYNSSK